MLVCKSLNWVHIPKTGGWWVVDALTRAGQHPDLSRPHKALSSIPLDLQNRDSYFVVRNPWDWYESFWSYLCERKKIRHLWAGAARVDEDTLTDDQRFYWSVGSMSFRECVFEMGHYRSFTEWVSSIAYRSDGTRAEPILMGSLRDTVSRILSQRDRTARRRFKQWCRSSERVNSSSHIDVRWDRDMIDFVERTEEPMIREFGFVPPVCL